jgi:hypothetical protein
MPAKKTISNATKPKLTYTQIIKDSNDPGYVNRLLVATPTTGLVRMEWVQSRYGQIIPVNWSMVQMVQYLNSFIPLRYSVSDAQNLIVKEAIEKDFQWLLLIEHDTCPPPDAFIRINQYIREAEVPIVSGLYYTKSEPSEPLLFRGRGTSYYDNWKVGDKVWVDGVPTGFLLINVRILQEMWKDSDEYMAGDTKTRKVFETPAKIWFDEATGQYNSLIGTSDLDWCTKVIKGNYFKKAGWPLIQKKKFPFLVDTKILCRHITEDGRIFPR